VIKLAKSWEGNVKKCVANQKAMVKKVVKSKVMTEMMLNFNDTCTGYLMMYVRM